MDEEKEVKSWPEATNTPDWPASPSAKEQRAELARKGILWIAIGALAVCVGLLLLSVNRFVNIWFKDQYVPLATAATAIILGGFAAYVIWRMTPRT